MNYWHLQMDPKDHRKFSKDIILRVLKEKKVIGMGENWNNKHGEKVQDPSLFKNNMHSNDVVLIRDGINPIALVQVSGNWYIDKNNDDELDWFTLRRPIEFLKTFGQGDKIFLDKSLKKYKSNHIQAPGTLTQCKWDNATNNFIKEWHLQIQKENIMSNINLTPERRKDITKLWNDYKEEYTNQQLKKLEAEIKKLQDGWKIYRDKLSSNNLTIDEYTNRLANDNAVVPGGYLCNFLERETRVIYGSSKPGNANNFEIKLNEDGETYTFRDQPLVKGKNKNGKESATKKFEEHIEPILSSIIDQSDIIEKVIAVEESKYAAKQVLRKLAVLDNHEDFLYIYSDGVIDLLHNEFLDSETETNLGKNHEIRIAINKILELENNPINAVLVSRFLWKYANSKGVADKNTPNVILYGPPGTEVGS